MSSHHLSRPLLHVRYPSEATHGGAFRALRLDREAFGVDGGPFFNLDHFRMEGPTFPPHPHSGFSAVTYVLPESTIGMVNRDSRGDRSNIAPGGLHWTAAGSGIVHEEVPERSGDVVQGMQIFVRQPVAQEMDPPVVSRVEADQVPVVRWGMESWARVLAGRYRDVTAPFEPPSRLALLDVNLAAGETLVCPDPRYPEALNDTPWNIALYLFAGSVDLGARYSPDRYVTASALIIFEQGFDPVQVTALDAGARMMVLTGEPLDQPFVSAGPFVLSSTAAIAAAVSRYQAGQMGRL